MLKAYFGPDLKTKLHGGAHEAGDANYIKAHDGGVARGRGIKPLPQWTYVVQYRHPIESIQSLFEFALHRQGTLADTRDEWTDFLDRNLDYWKRFVAKWCLELDPASVGGVHRVEYGALCRDTAGVMRGTVTFLMANAPVDELRLARAVESYRGAITRYVEDQRVGERVFRKHRDATDFRYFDDCLYAIEENLYPDYLAPLGIRRIGEQGEASA